MKHQATSHILLLGCVTFMLLNNPCTEASFLLKTSPLFATRHLHTNDFTFPIPLHPDDELNSPEDKRLLPKQALRSDQKSSRGYFPILPAGRSDQKPKASHVRMVPKQEQQEQQALRSEQTTPPNASRHMDISPAETRKLRSHANVCAETTATRRKWIQQAATSLLGVAGTLVPPSGIAQTLEVEASAVRTTLCDPNVSTWANAKEGRILHIVGTAHISSVSADLAANLVQEVKPDCLFLELDWQRIDRAFRGSRPIPGVRIALWDAQGNPRMGVTTTQGPNSIVEWLIRNIPTSPMIGGQGFVSGEEFVTSVEEAAKINSVVVLGDRDFGVSLQRLAEASSKTDVRKVLEADKVMAAMMKEEIPWIDQWGTSKRPTKEDVQGVIEELKTKAIVDKMMNIFKEYAPAMYVAMVEERDTIMSVRLDALTSFPTTVAVMGLAHVNGVTNNLEAIGWRRVPKQCWLE